MLVLASKIADFSIKFDDKQVRLYARKWLHVKCAAIRISGDGNFDSANADGCVMEAQSLAPFNTRVYLSVCSKSMVFSNICLSYVKI
jgi:hypothetical protein